MDEENKQEHEALLKRVNQNMDRIGLLVQEELRKLNDGKPIPYVLTIDPGDAPGMISNVSCPHCQMIMLGTMMENIALAPLAQNDLPQGHLH